ncbi:phosphoglycerate transporter protein PgtP [Glaesserella parasuis]|uniref:phosphoglycerate transporter protein PgtP n=1 Tax=Glaesserella parasuis TaxID=738 RepID=UPI00094F5974|nr:phosphoglycerate transporter protein PgtP [Glaesserella parasuis]MDG6345378.1 phosphoglycerate transporter protein PgtP [Glaesserella parasuis]MDG6770989.1 phosphoglycerate transporter protein PgtP [Glaesserella parasuis]MDO9796942.1 phosphoglycerate transporter protein PgtP [Glaesserella parasuis]MDO9873299.1 phosphoglycerate transporter protein PgtP [Glaesserella parasuis]MDO9913034.1 phosphoglycerate transporter protein PgtP [Glaesserella parasuis]
MFSFLKASAPAPRIESFRTDTEYRKLRWQVFAGVFIGYAAYYLIRKNFSLAIPYLIDEYGFSKADLGTVAVALSLAYGFSKFIMGNVSDRSNPKYFITIGLLGSAIISLIFGLVPGVLSSIPLMILLAALNGWFQGMGYPPGAKTMTNWFSRSERGAWWSWWNVSHNLGGGLIGPLAILGLSIFGVWQSLFYLPALIAIVLAFVVLYLMRDTPESQGLPPVDEWKGEKVLEKVESAHTLSSKDIFYKYIINNKFLWAIAIANVFVYFIRYGIIDWAPTYLKEVKHFTVDKQSWAYFLYEYAGIFGMLASGYLSDKVFKGHRAPPMLLFLVGVLIAIVVYWKNPAGNPLVDNICLVAIGFLIYGPVMMIGLQAADLVPRVATGTATGLTGLFGYLLGSASAGWVMGKLVDVYGWDGGFYALIASCFLGFGFIAFTLFHRPEKQ